MIIFLNGMDIWQVAEYGSCLNIFIGYVMAYHKNKRLKDVTNTGYPLEYCIVVADVYI